MKKIIIMILMISMMSLPVYADLEETLDNVVEKAEILVETGKEVAKAITELVDVVGHWSEKYVNILIEKGVVSGYQDGSFKPDSTVKVSEFTKMIMASLGKDVGPSQEGHWAEGYFQEAREMGVIQSGEFTLDDYNREINRGEMARMISRAIGEEYPADWEAYAANISDYDRTSSDYQNYVLKAYVKGIISGYPDGSFQYEKNATRAEASTMITRLIEKDERQLPELKIVEQPTDQAAKFENLDPVDVITAGYSEDTFVVKGSGGNIIFQGEEVIEVKNAQFPIDLGDSVIHGVYKNYENNFIIIDAESKGIRDPFSAATYKVQYFRNDGSNVLVKSIQFFYKGAEKLYPVLVNNFDNVATEEEHNYRGEARFQAVLDTGYRGPELETFESISIVDAYSKNGNVIKIDLDDVTELK